jgi:dephospho-CoA kinase
LRVIGLTGGIASGKTAVSDILAQRGAVILDTDLIAREVVEPGQAAWKDIQTEFGAEMFLPDGRLDRERLGARVFADPVARERLNTITHPRIRETLMQRLDGLRASAAPPPAAVLVVPLLFEKGLDAWVEESWVVDIPETLQRERLAARDGLAPDAVKARLDSQMSRADRLARATHVISNAGDRAALAAQVQALWQQMLEASTRGDT